MILKVNSSPLLADAHKLLDDYWNKHKHITITIEKRQRTGKQNNSIHKYFELLANELNEKGLDMRKMLHPEIDIPWDKNSVKKHIWTVIQKAMFGTTSTTRLKTDEVSKIYDVLNRSLIERHDVYIQFPSESDKL